MQRHDIQFPPKDAALREDVHELGGLVGEVLREQGGEELFALVEGDRVAAIRRREGDPGGAEELTIRVRSRPPAVARDLVRAFSTWFQAVNLAEKVHRIRRRRQYFLSGSGPQPQGVGDCLAKLRQAGFTLEQTLELIGRMRIEPVFRAHPTESTRRTLLRKQLHIAQLLFARMDPTLTPQERASVWGSMRSEVTTGWQTEEHPRQRLTVADEREHALFYIAEVIYRIVPAFYEEIESSLQAVFGADPQAIDLPNIIELGSWVGGDMDGNPDVHAKTIRETLARHHQLIVSTYFNEAQGLAAKLSQSASRVRISPELQKRIDEYSALLPGAQARTPARHDRMPYRVFLGQIAERLRNTYEGHANHYDNAGQLSADLELLAHSLRANRGASAGLHPVRRFLWRVRTFGFHLATLDVRQHTNVHHEVVGQGLADDSWLQRTPAERLARLTEALEKDQGPQVALDATGLRTLRVFEAMAQCRRRYGPLAIGAYIVSGATAADDALAVLLLARWAGVTDRNDEVPFDIAPLFESMDALEGCGEVMRTLLAIPVYQRHLRARGAQQVALIGYSESNKEAGIAASRWATHRAQADLQRVARDFDVRLTVFYSRGGSISRGAGRIDALIRSAPPGVVNGRLVLTEEGESVNQGYALRPVAMRTLERAFHALALATATARTAQAESADDLAVMAAIAQASRAAYVELVRQPAFYEYFRQVTPIDVIERMQIGNRPASRGGREGFEYLRAIPWVFAWTQSRHMLPGWFAVGTGLQAVLRSHGVERLRKLRRDWFFFAAVLDDVEAMLARTDLEIGGYYDALAEEGLRHFAATIRAEFELARRLILEIKGIGVLLDGDPTLQRSIMLRNPYVDPMHLMQVDLLKRWRASGRRDAELFDALLASISGISQGLQSTG
jgi:phosphoenolpyruvate carboxylase